MTDLASWDTARVWDASKTEMNWGLATPSSPSSPGSPSVEAVTAPR